MIGKLTLSLLALGLSAQVYGNQSLQWCNAQYTDARGVVLLTTTGYGWGGIAAQHSLASCRQQARQFDPQLTGKCTIISCQPATSTFHPFNP